MESKVFEILVKDVNRRLKGKILEWGRGFSSYIGLER